MIIQICDKCGDTGQETVYFRGDGEDTWDFQLCEECLKELFRDFLGEEEPDLSRE